MERWGKKENLSEFNLNVTLFHVKMFIKKMCIHKIYCWPEKGIFLKKKKKFNFLWTVIVTLETVTTILTFVKI